MPLVLDPTARVGKVPFVPASVALLAAQYPSLTITVTSNPTCCTGKQVARKKNPSCDVNYHGVIGEASARGYQGATGATGRSTCSTDTGPGGFGKKPIGLREAYYDANGKYWPATLTSSKANNRYKVCEPEDLLITIVFDTVIEIDPEVVSAINKTIKDATTRIATFDMITDPVCAQTKGRWVNDTEWKKIVYVSCRPEVNHLFNAMYALVPGATLQKILSGEIVRLPAIKRLALYNDTNLIKYTRTRVHCGETLMVVHPENEGLTIETENPPTTLTRLGGYDVTRQLFKTCLESLTFRLHTLEDEECRFKLVELIELGV